MAWCEKNPVAAHELARVVTCPDNTAAIPITARALAAGKIAATLNAAIRRQEATRRARA